MNGKSPLLVITETFNLPKGTVVENYESIEGGVITEKNDYLPSKAFIVLNENISKDDEKKIREMIRQQLRLLFWNLYTKQATIVGNL